MPRNKTVLLRSLALAAAAFTSLPMNPAVGAEPGKRILKRRTRDQLQEGSSARPALPKRRIHQPGVRAMKKKPTVETPADQRARQPGMRYQPGTAPGVRMRKDPGIRMSPGVRMAPRQQKK